MEERQYRIGEMAEMTGLTRDTLRFYEKKGVIAAKRRENGYRYYTERDMYKLMSICYHRKMNDSLQTIEGIVSHCSWNPRESTSCGARRRRSRRSGTHCRALTRLRLTEWDLDAVEQNLYGCVVRKFPKAYILGKYTDFTQGLTNWFNLSVKNPVLDMAYFYSTYSYEEANGIDYRDTRLLFYQGLDYETERLLAEKGYAVTEERECLYSVVRSANISPETAMWRSCTARGRSWGWRQRAGSTAILWEAFQGQFAIFLCRNLYTGEMRRPRLSDSRGNYEKSMCNFTSNRDK